MSLAQPTKPVAETFLKTESRRVPLLRLLEGNPPAPIELKIERPVLIHFWATWCAPCLDELPQLVRSSSELKKAGIDLILISVDSSAATKVPAFLIRLGIPEAKVYWDPRSDLYKKFSIPMLPSTVVVDRSGNELGRVLGAATWNGQTEVSFLKNLLFP